MIEIEWGEDDKDVFCFQKRAIFILNVGQNRVD